MNIARKLHAQFGHPPQDRLLKFLERAGKTGDKELIESVKVVSKSCTICKEFSKPCPKPVVGFPHASNFNESMG